MDSMHKELLKNFKELYDDGLITKEEYEGKRAEVLAMIDRSVRLSETTSARPSVSTAAGRPSTAAYQPTSAPAQQATPSQSQYGSINLANQSAAGGQQSRPQSQNLSIDQILNELGNVSLEPPSARPSIASQSSRPSAAAASVSAGSRTEADLDRFVEMLAGSRDSKQVQAMARQAESTTVAAPAAAAAAAAPTPSAGSGAAAAPAVDASKFINCEHVIQGHTGYVFDLAFHNNRLFSASADKTIMVWDLASMTCSKVLRGHTHSVYALCVDQPGNRLFSAGWDLVIRVWNLTTLEEVRELKGHTGYISCLRIFDDKLYSGSWDGSIKVWSLQTLKNIDTMSIEHTGTIWDITVVNNMVYTASQDKTIKNWSLKTFNYKDTLGEIGSRQHTNWVLGMVPMGTRLFSCSRDKTIFEWDLSQRHIKVVSVIDCEQPVTALTRKGNYLISGDAKGTIDIWHAETKERVDTIRGAHRDWVYKILPVGNYIFTCSRDKTIKIWV